MSNCPFPTPAPRFLRGVTRTVRMTILDASEAAVDLTLARSIVVTISLDGRGSEFTVTPQFTIGGDGNNVVTFAWYADQQKRCGHYTFELIADYGDRNEARVNWHKRQSVELVEYGSELWPAVPSGSSSGSGDVTETIAIDSVIDLTGETTMNGVGMSAYEQWLASDYSTGYEQSVDGFFTWMRRPATDAAEAATTQMGVIQGRADADHIRAEQDHQKYVDGSWQNVYRCALAEVASPIEGDICIVPDVETEIPVPSGTPPMYIDIDLPGSKFKWERLPYALVGLNNLALKWGTNSVSFPDSTATNAQGTITTQGYTEARIDTSLYNLLGMKFYSIADSPYIYLNGAWVKSTDIALLSDIPNVYVAKATNNVFDVSAIAAALNAGKAVFVIDPTALKVFSFARKDTLENKYFFYRVTYTNSDRACVYGIAINSDGTYTTTAYWLQGDLTTVGKLNFSRISNTPTTLAGYGITNAYTKNEIDAKVSSVYKPAGSAASVAALGSLTAANLGNVYNMSAAFTTTSDFVEGASKDYHAGTNVVIVNTGTDADPVYKYDVLAGMVDLSGYEETTNKVTSLSAQSTDAQYPSAKAVYDAMVAGKELFVATYGTTTAAEIDAAVAANKVVMCREGVNLFTLVFYDNNVYTFSFVLNGGSYRRQLKRSDSSWSRGTTNLQLLSDKVQTLSGYETNQDKYPSTKAVYDALATKQNVISSSNKLDYSLIDNVPQDATPVSQSDQQFTFRQTAGGAKPGASLAKVTEVRGNTLVWNQLVQDGRSNVNGLTATLSNGVFEISGTISYTYSGCILIGKNFIIGHKYYVYTKVVANPNNIVFDFCLLNQSSGGKNGPEIFTASSTGASAGFSRVTIDTDFTGVKVAMSVTDLTLMFGAGNEPSTVAEFEALYPLPYYAYNAGTLLNNKVATLETVGFNQWDEEWELGYYNEGVPIAASTQIRSNKDKPIPVFPNTNYFIHCGANTGRVSWIFWYDAGDNYISKTQIGQSNEEVTSPDNARFARFQCNTAYGTTYNHDICINLSDTSKNGTYEPYEKHTLTLNLPTLTGKLNGEGSSVTIAADGAKSAGSAYDEFVVENGYITKFVKRVGSVDLGDGEWTQLSGKTVFRRSLGTAKAPSSNYTPANIMCANYVTTGSGDVESSQSGIGLSVSKMITIGDSRYSDATAFGTAMSGVLLYYELAEPLTYILGTPIPVTYFVNDLGTESITPTGVDANGVPNTAPLRASLQYGLTEGEMYGLMEDTSSAVTGKADKVTGATNGHLAALDSSGNLTDSGKSASDFGTYSKPSGGIPASDLASGVIPTVPTISTDIATDKSSTTKTAAPSAVYNEVHPAVVSSQPAGGFLPNVVYDLGTITGTVTFSLAAAQDATIANPYFWTFETGGTAPTITWPANLTWAGGSAPTINASKHYEIMVRNGYATSLEF